MTRAGRPSKLDEDLKTKLFEAIRRGAHLETACQSAGVSYFTVCEWIRRGEGRDSDRPTSKEFAQFAQDIHRAIADSEMMLLSRIHKAAQTDARHAQWILSRRFPERWSDTQQIRVQVVKQVEGELNLLFEAIADDADIPAAIKRRIFQHAVNLKSLAAVAESN